MILSTAWTTPAVVRGMKCETRRDWSPRQITLAQKQIDLGRRVALWDKSPRNGGKCYGSCRLVSLTLDEPSCEIPDEAWEREGFHILLPLRCEFMKGWSAADVWRFWRSAGPGENPHTVVRFEGVRLNFYGCDLFGRWRTRSAGIEPTTLAELRTTMDGMEGWEKA